MGRIAGWFLFLASSAMEVIKFGLWAVGTSTVVEDVELLPEKVRSVLGFIEQQPAVAFYGFFALMAGVGLWLAIRQPRAISEAKQSDTGRGGVTSYNQSGGITAHTVNGGNGDVGKRRK